MAKSQSAITMAITALIIGIVGFAVVSAFSTANVTWTVYPHATRDGTIVASGTYNTTKLDGTAESWLTLETADAAGNYSMGDSYVAAESLNRVTGIPQSTWTFVYYAAANVTNKCKLYANITEVDDTGAFVGFIEEYSGLTSLIQTGNATYTFTKSIANYTFADTDNYVKCEYFLQKTDATVLKVDLLIDGQVASTHNTVVLTYQVLPALEQMMISLVWLISFATIALYALLHGLGIGKGE